MKLAPWIAVLALLLILYFGRDIVGANLGLTKVINRSRASGVHPELQLALDEWDGPFAIKVTSGLRTNEQQAALFAQGRTAPGEIVTDAATVESTAHGRGGAIDVAPAPNGIALYDVSKPEVRQLWDVMLAHFVARGFKTKIVLADGKVDWPHVQFYNWRSLPFPPPDYDAAYKGSVSV